MALIRIDDVFNGDFLLGFLCYVEFETYTRIAP